LPQILRKAHNESTIDMFRQLYKKLIEGARQMLNDFPAESVLIGFFEFKNLPRAGF